MGCYTFWLVRCRSTLSFHIVVWIGYVIITATGSLTVFYALQKEQQHWYRFFTSTCHLFGELVKNAEHEKVEFSYSLWSEPICSEGFKGPEELPQPHTEFSTRPLDVPQQFQWDSEGKLHWQPVPDTWEYEVMRCADCDSHDVEESWETIYRGTETQLALQEPAGCFCVRSIRVTPPDDPVYERISQILVEAAQTIPNIASVYTMRDYSDHEYVFIVSPAMDVNKDGVIDPETERLAPVGETYPMENFAPVPPGVHEPVITDEIVEDDWGVLYSAVVALYHPDGSREGYVGVDYPVKVWQQNVRRTQITYSVFLVIVLVMYFTGIVFVTRLRLASKEQSTTASRLHRAFEELTEAQIMAETASRAKSYFLTNMSHEVRTPMNALVGFAEIASRRLLECCPPDQWEDNKQTIDLIEKSSSDLLTIINDILDFSNVDANQIEIEWVAVEPRKIMEDVYNALLARLMEKPELTLVLHTDKSVPQWVYGDPTRLRQVLSNICGNAIKFSERGMIRFSCRMITLDNTPQAIKNIKETYGSSVKTALCPKGEPITLLQFIVQDEGVGIPEVLRSRLFIPFTQADGSLTRKFGGTGLGLAIAKHLVELMGGDITVESEEESGSTFRVTLAVEVMQDPTEVVQHSGIVLLSDVDKPLSGMHILVVEDGKVNQIVIMKMLQDAGATVRIAENGKLGLEAVESAKQPFDVILMDMQMPVMDGYEATFRLRQNGFTKPIIAVTAHALTGDAEKTIQAGCSAHLSKPVDRSKLIDMILKHDNETFSVR